jgi:hypothetical protein
VVALNFSLNDAYTGAIALHGPHLYTIALLLLFISIEELMSGSLGYQVAWKSTTTSRSLASLSSINEYNKECIKTAYERLLEW